MLLILYHRWLAFWVYIGKNVKNSQNNYKVNLKQLQDLSGNFVKNEQKNSTYIDEKLIYLKIQLTVLYCI